MHGTIQYSGVKTLEIVITVLTVVYSGHIHMNYDLDQRQRGGSLVLTDQNRSAAKVGMYRDATRALSDS